MALRIIILGEEGKKTAVAQLVANALMIHGARLTGPDGKRVPYVPGAALQVQNLAKAGELEITIQELAPGDSPEALAGQPQEARHG